MLLGHAVLKVVQLPLPLSTRVYLQLHNEQLEKTQADMNRRSSLT